VISSGIDSIEEVDGGLGVLSSVGIGGGGGWSGLS
tara:strand:+ start:821 stop:925 length:105 start_codon:yes stop_codon:yes gene_type:complete